MPKGYWINHPDLKPVKVVSVDIPFGEVLLLTFKSAVAGLIAFGIPIAIIIAVTG